MPSDEYTQHIVVDGEDIVSIALDARMDPDAIWNDPKNVETRQKKQEEWRRQLGSVQETGYVLQPGDTLWIPPWKPQKVSIETNRRHTFRLKGVPQKLILYLQENDQPRAGVAYTLKVGEGASAVIHGGRTDGSGKIEHWVQPADRHAVLTIPPLPGSSDEPETRELQLGYLDPVSTPEGLRARLFNLGFLDGREPSDQELQLALADFQRHFEVEGKGEANTATLVKLVEVHKS